MESVETHIGEDVMPEAEEIVPGGVHDDLPLMPAPTAEPGEVDIARALHAVRSYHRADPGSGEFLPCPDEDVLPALMYPFRKPESVRHDYPLFLYPPDIEPDKPLCQPMSELLHDLLDQIAPNEEDARILKDNLSRLEHFARETLAAQDRGIDAIDCLRQGGQEMLEDLSLPDQTREQLQADLDRLIEVVPQSGRLIGLNEHTPLFLFLRATRRRAAIARTNLRNEISHLRHRLRDLIFIDIVKDPKGRKPEILSESFGAAGPERIDSEVYSEVIGPARGSVAMEKSRRQRIENVVELLSEYLDSHDTPPLMRVVHHSENPPSWRTTEADWNIEADATVCNTAAEIFDNQADEYAKLFAAMRVARLELASAYDPDRHEDLLKNFDWEAFTREEMLAMPPVLALETAQNLAGEGMLSLSRLQLSGRPVIVLVLVHPAEDPGLPLHEDPMIGYRFELAYLGISHRESLVQQSSAASPRHLMAGYDRALESMRASLHVVAGVSRTYKPVTRLGMWLHESAALEGRAHPFFRYDPAKGESWAQRLDFSSNPQPEKDWPTYSFPYRTASNAEETMDLAFTFADFALLEPQYRDHFRVVPEECVCDELISMEKYLTLSTHEEYLQYIPIIWAVDSDGCLQRLVVSRRLAYVCRDRLGFWHTLQELAGIRNEYVRVAVDEEREKLKAEFEHEKEQLALEYNAEIERVRNETAQEVMERLAAGLLATDPSTITASPASAQRTIQPPSAPVTESTESESTVLDGDDAKPAEEAETEVDEGPEDPWIDSILCTTCNDCTNINSQMFVYNANKQAVIGDPSAGTYAELVQAAEKCPSRCIHPGTPQNPDEPNLEELIKRAKPFR